MLELGRTVRFCIGQDGTLAEDAAVSNSFAAWPPMRGLGRYYELEVVCRGEADAVTGYFMNIKRIDAAVREAGLTLIAEACREPGEAALGGLMRGLLDALNPRLDGSVVAVSLRLTPTHRLRLEQSDMTRVLMSQRYEFAAAHRLHSDRLSPEENVEVFGKCNNPAGHGHNYRVEVTVCCPVDDAGRMLAAERLDELVDDAVIQKLDHKHLNVDVPEFEGLNTSVENIARVIYRMLADRVADLGVELDEVRVWETGKTVCTYRR